MITGLPPYRPPIAEPLRCLCRVKYLVYLGSLDEEAASELHKAQEKGAHFVFARKEPFYECECGEVFDLALDDARMVM